ncbi:hypothetical protein EVAR_28312_1 [Eumeta japonica]|uniref:Uncharacterized protein n=1 Tax=Eumeta variegata TaxID=151549 RepID=A0A4C1V8K1_EUMVA|nr:hypothetical protein EVAR_28312_1 [Eumeta japonica]
MELVSNLHARSSVGTLRISVGCSETDSEVIDQQSYQTSYPRRHRKKKRTSNVTGDATAGRELEPARREDATPLLVYKTTTHRIRHGTRHRPEPVAMPSMHVVLALALAGAVRCQLAHVIYASPSAVSHQSRIDIKHGAVLSAPAVYAPAVFVTRPKASSIVAPALVPADLWTGPIAYGFFHSLPLTRALEHPVSLHRVENAMRQNVGDDIHKRKTDVDGNTEGGHPAEASRDSNLTKEYKTEEADETVISSKDEKSE